MVLDPVFSEDYHEKIEEYREYMKHPNPDDLFLSYVLSISTVTEITIENGETFIWCHFHAGNFEAGMDAFGEMNILKNPMKMEEGYTLKYRGEVIADHIVFEGVTTMTVEEYLKSLDDGVDWDYYLNMPFNSDERAAYIENYNENKG